MENIRWAKGNIVVHKASKEEMVVMDTSLDYCEDVWCRYFNKIDGQYCQKEFKKFEFN